jgi:3-mercaptopyruvate sulfurtransferase SseA
MMMDKGFTKVRPLEGGIEAWIAAGYETVTVLPEAAGERPESTQDRERTNDEYTL